MHAIADRFRGYAVFYWASGFFGVLGIWKLTNGLMPEESRWLLPAPDEVIEYLVDRPSVIANAAFVTGESSLIGLLAGAFFGLLLGLIFHLIPFLNKSLLPFISTLPAIPVVAIAPLVVVWFGFGLTSRVLIVAFITFFPVLVTVLTGLSQGYRAQREFFEAQGVKWGLRLRYMDGPAALGYFGVGLRTAAPFAVVGAIVAEYVAPRDGLGYLVLTNALRTNLVGVIASAIACAALGLVFVGGVKWLSNQLTKHFPPE